MERRNRSIKALDKLIYIDSLDSYEKANQLVSWHNEYLIDKGIDSFDLELEDLKILEELFFKSLKFLEKHKEDTKQELINTKKMQQFFKH